MCGGSIQPAPVPGEQQRQYQYLVEGTVRCAYVLWLEGAVRCAYVLWLEGLLEALVEGECEGEVWSLLLCWRVRVGGGRVGWSAVCCLALP